MPAITKAELRYNDYSWTAVPGDNPHKKLEDSGRFSRKEGYEVVSLLNGLVGENNADLPLRTRQICEWMIHEKLPSTVQGRGEVKAWIGDNYPALAKLYPG